jgi:hypothetical protein
MLAITGTRAVRSLAIVTLLLGAAACSGNPPPPGAVTTSTPTVQTSTPTPTPTVTPVDQQIAAAVRAYYAELIHATQTNDTTGLTLLVSRACPCYNSVRIIQDNRRRGRSGPAAAITVDQVKPHDVIGITAGAVVAFRAAAYNLVDKRGTVLSRIGARSYKVDLSFVSTNGAWILHNVFNLAA